MEMEDRGVTRVTEKCPQGYKELTPKRRAARAVKGLQKGGTTLGPWSAVNQEIRAGFGFAEMGLQKYSAKES